MKDMEKNEALPHFIRACYTAIRCEMCGEERHDRGLPPLVITDVLDLSKAVWEEGWRVWQLDGQSGKAAVLCQHCKDDQR